MTVLLTPWERLGMTYNAYDQIEKRVIQRAEDLVRQTKCSPKTAVEQARKEFGI
jgi:hypothetical protein